MDLKSTSKTRVFEESLLLGCGLCYSEYVYFKSLDPKIDTYFQKSEFLDLSSNMSPAYFREAFSSGMRKFCIDTEKTLASVEPYASEIELFVRISCKLNKVLPGCTASELESLMRKARGMNIKISGIVMYCYDIHDIASLADELKEAIRLGNMFGHKLTRIHFMEHGISNFVESKDEVGEEMKPMIAVCEEAGMKMSAEASKMLLSNAYTIYTRVTAVKRKLEKDYVRYLIYTDNGVYCSFYNAKATNEVINPQPILLSQNPEGSNQEMFVTTVFGPTCDSIDTLGTDFRLPFMTVGDWFMYKGNGYLCNSYYTLFNGFAVPEIIVQNA